MLNSTRIFTFLFLCLLSTACNDKPTQPPAETPASEAPQGKRANFEGTYDHEGNSDEFMGEMVIQHLGNDRFSFKISTGTMSGCTGDLDGEAVIGNDGVAVFSAPGCESLRFTFGVGQVSVEEKGCDGYHGMRCPYGGTYKLRQ